MRHLKKFGLAMLTVAALATLTGSSSATTLTSPAGTTLGVGTKIKASSEGAIETDFSLGKITCQKSSFEGSIEKAGGASETVRIPLTLLTFTECGVHTLQILQSGSLEIHTSTGSADGNGTVTWSGGEVTILTHSPFFGTRHCLYRTENTDIGTLTGSKNREGKTATLDIGAAEVPLKETDVLCGPSFVLTGSYLFEAPDYLDVD